MRDERGARPRWDHEVPPEGRYGAFSVRRLSDEEMTALTLAPYFGALVDYRLNFPEMPRITQVWESDGGNDILWMADGPQEVAMMAGLSRGHSGHVLVTGLGMGIVQQLLLRDPAVEGVTTIEAHPHVRRLHEGSHWWRHPGHHLIEADVSDVLADLAGSGDFDGYVLDHWDALGPHLEEKVAFLRLLEEAGQAHRSVAMWGFWWEVQESEGSEDPDTERLLDETERCARCGSILGDSGADGASNFWVQRGRGGMCAACEEQGGPRVP